MNDKLDLLVEALRHELQQYGEMLSLVEQQQDHLIQRDADEVLQSVTLINAHSGELQRARHRRVECFQSLAETLAVPTDGGFETLLPALPAPRRSQVQALMDENNRLLKRIQQRARQNHLLLSHTLEHMNRFMQTIMGTAKGAVYDGVGGVAALAPVQRVTYEAVG